MFMVMLWTVCEMQCNIKRKVIVLCNVIVAGIILMFMMDVIMLVYCYDCFIIAIH